MRLRIPKSKAWRFNLLASLTLIVLAGILIFYLNFAAATFQGNTGTAAWGDSTAGRIRISHSTYSLTSPYTAFATSFRPSSAPSSSPIQFVVNKDSPTRNEKIIGDQLDNGDLYINDCSSTCTALTNLNDNSWHTTILGTGVVTRAFDIAYEQLSGRTMVVYAGNQTGYLFYCIYDGTSWGPVSTCAPTVGTNSITLTDGTTTLTGTPAWVTLMPQGGQFGANRTNNILMAVEDTNHYVLTMSWNGSSWNTSDAKVLTTTGGSSVTSTDNGTVYTPAFDVGWESVSGMEMAVYANGTALSYSTSTGSGWGSATTIATLSTAAAWVRLASDPLSNRMSLIAAYSTTAQPYIWKTDGSTVGWTSGTSATMSQNVGENVDTAWLKAGSGTPKAIFTSSDSSGADKPYYSTWTQSGGFVAWANVTGTNSSYAIVGNELTPSPNSDIVTIFQNDQRGHLDATTFNGSSWGSLITTNLSTTLVNNTTGRTNSSINYTQKAYQYSYTPYSTWSLNWRVYSDYANTGNPSVPLAAEDTTPTVQPNAIVRLRINYAELGGGSEGDTRKKLQYSSGAGCPDSVSCVWTDVGAAGSGSIWRYSTSGGLADNATVPSTELDGSNSDGYSVTNGTASASGDVQNSGTVQEYDYTLQNNGSTVGTDYYFRGYDYGPSVSGGSLTNLNPIYREQIVNTAGVQATNCTNGTTSQVCAYPTFYSYSTAPNPPTFYFPTDGSSNSTTTPVIQLSTVDVLGNYVQYTIQWCPTNSFPCSSGGGAFDQVGTAGSGEPGWSNQDADGGLAYNAAPNIINSTTAQYTVPPGTFQPDTTYYMEALAYDPTLALSSAYSTPISFTTAALNILIQGGACIGGVGSSCTSGSGSSISKVCIGGVVGVTCN